MNLLPDETRKSIAAEYRNKALVAGSLILTFVAGVAFLALMPAMLVSSEERATNELSVLESRYEQTRKDREGAQEAQALISALLPVATSSMLVERAIIGALSLRPSGIRVESVSFSGEKTRSILIAGTSENRDSLNAYRTALEHSGIFNRVSVPVGALVGAASGFFSMTLTL